jgi:glucarate dehydratase
VKATPVNIPLVAPYRWSVGYFPGFSKAIVEVRTEEGLTGIGEAPSAGLAGLVEDALGPRLVGADPRDLAGCERRALPPIQAMKNADDESVLRAWGGIEMALWDLKGRIQGRPVAELLGGFARTEIPYTEYFSARLANGEEGGESTPRDVADYCARMQEEHGAVAFEGKVGFGDLDFEVEMVREIRNAIGPGPMLRLDANMGWSVMTARQALRRLEPYDIRSIEDPAPTLSDLARLRAGTSISFSTHDPDVRMAASHGVPDAIVIGIGAVGGISRTVALAHVCEHLGVDLWFYSPDTSVANAAYRQVAAALSWLGEPSQTLLRWHADDVVEGGPVAPTNGVLTASREPGFGVNLDREALRRCHQSFKDRGPFDQYLHPERSGYGPRRIAYNFHGR